MAGGRFVRCGHGLAFAVVGGTVVVVVDVVDVEVVVDSDVVVVSLLVDVEVVSVSSVVVVVSELISVVGVVSSAGSGLGPAASPLITFVSGP
jgi:hypothetical protein